MLSAPRSHCALLLFIFFDLVIHISHNHVNHFYAMHPGFFLFLSLLGSAYASPVGKPEDNESPIFPRGKNMKSVRIRDDVHGERDVAYWVTPDGYAIIDGDVIFGTEEELLSRIVNGHEPPHNRARAFTQYNPWPSATVKYNYEDATAESVLKYVVDPAIELWKNKTGYLNFIHVTNSATPQNGVVTIKKTICGGCNANIGYSDKPLAMNLQQGCGLSGGSCGVPEAVHEFGHVLGKSSL